MQGFGCHKGCSQKNFGGASRLWTQRGSHFVGKMYCFEDLWLDG